MNYYLNKEFKNDVIIYLKNKLSLKNKGYSLTKDGPAPYSGNILDNPDCVWQDDIYDSERIKEAEIRIIEQGDVLPDYWRNKYENDGNKYWHLFYKRNSDNFYKDRHYLHIVFTELDPINKFSANNDIDTLSLLEIGCGVGNAIIPLLELNPRLRVHAIDFARSAINILKEHSFSISGRLFPSCCCCVNDDIPVKSNSMDIVLCIFVLSAMEPKAQVSVLKKIHNVLKPGGKLFIRDYGRHDEAQLRFGKGSKLADNFYVRQDGTCAYYFDLKDLKNLTEFDLNGSDKPFKEEEAVCIFKLYYILYINFII
jgi:methyltransferase-like protein 6